MNFTSIHLIYNPNSTGPSKEYAKELMRQLEQHQFDLVIKLHATKREGHAEELAYTIAKNDKTPLLVSSSGDGGYHEVVNGAMKAQLEGASPICTVLAAGNANDHSRTLIKHSTFELITNNTVKKIDLLKITIKDTEQTRERYAHSYIGFGLTPEIAAELNKNDLNAFKESWIAINTFIKYQPFTINHNRRDLSLDSIVFANIGEMAKVLKMAKDSLPNDGLFEVIAFDHTNKLRLLHKFAKASVQGLEANHQYKKYTFTVPQKISAQLDGEVMNIMKDSAIEITSEKQILATLID